MPRRVIRRSAHARRRTGALAIWLLLAAAALLSLRAPAVAANTDPTFALTRARAVRSTGDRVTVTLEGSFGVADAVQLALPLEVVITQGGRRAQLDLAGHVRVSVDGGAPQDAPAPGVVAVTSRAITLVLPPGFGPGEAVAQIVGTYAGEAIASNQLRFPL
jgi:hypothetical protein